MQSAQQLQSQGLLPASPQAAPVQVPRSPEAMQGLAAKRAELTRQLEDLAERREELTDAMEDLAPSQLGDMDSRVKLIDARSLAVERDLIITDDAIAKGLAAGVSWGPNGPPSGYVTGQSQVEAIESAVRSASEDAVFTAFTVGVTSVLGVWVLWRGFRRFVLRRKDATPALADPSRKIEALQQSVDVIALEMERVSEAQRFLTKTLTERVPEIAGGAARTSSKRT